jgi:FecR protein/PEGA domain
MNTQTNNCGTVCELWAEQDAGRVLTAEELEIIEVHLEDCSLCRLEDQSLSAVGIEGADGPATPLDDLTRRRWVGDTLDGVARHEAKNQASRSRRWMYGAAAAAVVLVAFAAFMLGRAAPQPGEELPIEAPVLAKATVDYQGHFLLSTGKVVSNPTNEKIVQGMNIAVDDGQAAIDLTTGVSAFLAAGTQINVEQLNSDRMEVRLLTGTVTVLVDPTRQGPQFQVLTRAGSATVTGTAFSVAADLDDVVLRVFRGSVQLDDNEHPPRKVGIGQAATYGKSGLSSISLEEQAGAGRLMKILDMLTSTDTAHASIQSLPAGATVSIDEIILGRTPLVARVREGHRQLELALAGYAPVRELVEVGTKTKLERVFDLGRMLAHGDAGVVENSGVASRKRQPKVEKTAGELLVEAQALRARREWEAAASTYEELVSRYSDSAEARASYVSMGNILLDHLKRPVKALNAFEQYLSRIRKGTLAQEAAFGRAMALKSLGRSSEEIFALKIFLADFPSAIQASKVRSRLRQLEER